MQGQSWCIGGDSNASTIASFLRFYTPDIQGASLGSHIGEVCASLIHSFIGILKLTPFVYFSVLVFLIILKLPPTSPPKHTHCIQLCYGLICPPFQYEPSKDVFNAAQSGAMIPDLVAHEFDYLYKEVRDVSLQSCNKAAVIACDE